LTAFLEPSSCQNDPLVMPCNIFGLGGPHHLSAAHARSPPDPQEAQGFTAAPYAAQPPASSEFLYGNTHNALLGYCQPQELPLSDPPSASYCSTSTHQWILKQICSNPPATHTRRGAPYKTFIHFIGTRPG
jgi:hypothetical protein